MKKYKKSTVLLASFGMLLATAIWGFAFVVVKEAVEVITPMYMLAFRFTVASAGMAVLFAKRMRKLNKKLILHGAWLGLWMFLAYFLQTWGCKYTTAGKNAFITVVYVVIVPFLAWLLFHEKPGVYNIVAAILGFAGVGMLTLNGEGGINIGDVLTLGCGILYAVQIVYVDRYTQTEDPILLTVMQVLAAAVLSWICAPFIEGAPPIDALFTGNIAVGMLYLGLGSSMISFLLQNVGQKYTPPATAALLLSMESVFGVLSSVIVLGEQVSPKMFVGCAVMLFAIILAETRLEFLPFMSKKREEGNAG